MPQDGIFERRSEVVVSEAGNRRGYRNASKERRFRSHFSGAVKVRRLATSDRPFSSQPVYPLSPFQNGDIGLNQTSASGRRLSTIY